MMKNVTRMVADYYDVWITGVYSQLRKRDYVKVRQISAFIMVEIFGKTMTETGAHFKRGHSDISHSLKKVKDDIATDEIFRYEVFYLIEKARALPEDKTKMCYPKQFKILRS